MGVTEGMMKGLRDKLKRSKSRKTPSSSLLIMFIYFLGVFSWNRQLETDLAACGDNRHFISPVGTLI